MSVHKISGKRITPKIDRIRQRRKTIHPPRRAPRQRDASKTSPATSFEGRMPGELTAITVSNIEVALSWCPPGRFLMGLPLVEKDRSAGAAQVEVELPRGYWMSRTEVTQELYESVIGKNPSSFKGPKNPVEQVSHIEAVKFATKLTQRLHESRTLPLGWEIRLPKEAEWEYAARAGTNTTFPFGNTLNSKPTSTVTSPMALYLSGTTSKNRHSRSLQGECLGLVRHRRECL